MTNNSYLFPNPDFYEMNNEGLKEYIQKHLDQARDQTDGSDCNSEVRIDYAQDVIGQARDILTSRGVTFSAEEKNQLDFLGWPRTDEQISSNKIKQEKEREERILYMRNIEALKEKTRPILSALLIEENLPEDVDMTGITFQFGQYSLFQGPDAPNATEVLKMKKQVEEVHGEEINFYITSLNIPEQKPEDIEQPLWFISLPLTPNLELWKLIKMWYVQGRFSSPEFSKGHYHWCMDGLMPE